MYDVIAAMLAMINECLMILLFMMMANGWMTVWVDYDTDETVEIYLPLFLLIVMVHLIFACLAFIDRNAYHKYHDFQGSIGVGLVIAKFILIIVYYYFYLITRDKIPKNYKKFYMQIV